MSKTLIFLDDVRQPGPGWTLVRWPEEAIALLQTSKISEISLDHDLGEEGPKARTGYDVLVWLEEQVATKGFVPPVIHIHTSNAAAHQRMEAAVESIRRLAQRNEEKRLR